MSNTSNWLDATPGSEPGATPADFSGDGRSDGGDEGGRSIFDRARGAGALPSSPEEQKTILFLHAAGGAGATTLAVNTAAHLALKARPNSGEIGFLDFDFQHGDAHLHFDTDAQSRLIDIVQSPDRLDGRMLDQLMVPGPTGIRILTSPPAPIPFDAVAPELIDRMMSLATKRFRHVVIDMPLALSHWTSAAIKRADHVVLVTQVNVISLRAAQRLLTIMSDSNIEPRSISIAANRFTGKLGGPGVGVEHAEKALGRPVEFVVPSDFAGVIDSLDQGLPIVAHRPASKVSRAIADMADKLTTGVSAAKARPGLAFNFRKSR